MKMNLSAKGRKLLGAYGLGRSDRRGRRVTDPDGGSAQYAATDDVGFSSTDEIMNTKTNTLWCKGLAMLALTIALAGTALGQVQVLWDTPADMTYGQPLSGAQLNARAQLPDGTAVAGTFRYAWTPPDAPVDARDGEGPGSIPILNQRHFTLTQILEADADSQTANQQTPDWRFLDAGDDQVLSVIFQPTGQAAMAPVTVQVDVNKAPLTVFPRNKNRTYGRENYPGFENFNDFPGGATYPNGEILFDGNRQLLSNDGDNDPGTLGNVLTRGGVAIDFDQIDTATSPDAGQGYAVRGTDLVFEGFVRGETYGNLAIDADSLASTAEKNAADGNRLVRRPLFRYQVKDGDGNDVFRAAPVGTTGNVTFVGDRPPLFKNYDTNPGSGVLTVTKAVIKFEGQKFTSANNTEAPKIFGDAVSLENGGRIDQGILKNPDTGILNDFRLGEGEIFDFLVAESDTAAADANVGTSSIELSENPPQGFNVNLLRNTYDLQLTDGSLQKVARKIELRAIPSDPPGNLDHANTRGFLFNIYGDFPQPPSFTVLNPAPHHLIDNAATYRGTPNTFERSQLKGAAFDLQPSVTHTVNDRTIVGQNYPINISGGDGQGSNYSIEKRHAGVFEVVPDYVVIEINSLSAFKGADLRTPTFNVFGVNPHDEVRVNGAFDPIGSLRNILRPGAPLPTVDLSAVDRNVAASYPMMFSNIPFLSAQNYLLYFNDVNGIRNRGDLNQNVGIEVGNLTPKLGQKFDEFSFNVFNSTTANSVAGFNDTNHPLAFTDGSQASTYVVGLVTATTEWPSGPGRAVTFGSNMNADFLDAFPVHPLTGEPFSQSAAPQLVEGVDYVIAYFLKEDGAANFDNAPFKKSAGVAVNDDGTAGDFPAVHVDGLARTRTVKAGKTHTIQARVKLTQAGIAKVVATNKPDGNPFTAPEFYPPAVNFALSVTARTIDIHIKEVGQNDNGKADQFFRTPIPNLAAGASPEGDFKGFQVVLDKVGDLTGDLDGGQIGDEIKNGTNRRVEILDAAGNIVTPGTVTTPLGSYTMRYRGLEAQNGNLAFNFINGTFTIKPIKVRISWTGDLADVRYGDPLPDSVRTALILTANVPSTVGSIVYSPDPGVGSLLDAGQNQELTAQFIATDPNYANSDKATNEIDVNARDITLQVRDQERIFGDAAAPFELVTPLNSLLVTQRDRDEVSFTATVSNNGAAVDAARRSYTIIPGFVDPNDRLGDNYNVTIVNGVHKVNPRPVTMTVQPQSIPFLENAADFTRNLSDIMDIDGDNIKPNDVVQIDGLASFHNVNNNRGRFLNFFPNFDLESNAPSNLTVGSVHTLFIDGIGGSAAAVGLDGKAAALTHHVDNGNYAVTIVNSTLTVAQEKVEITGFGNTTITYGQKISRSGKNRNDNGATKLNTIKALDAAGNVPLVEGGVVYTFDSIPGNLRRPTQAGGSRLTIQNGDVVPNDILLPAGTYKIKATATPRADQTNIAPNTKVSTVTVEKRQVNIRLKDRAAKYGQIRDLQILRVDNNSTEVGLIRRPGESDKDYNNRFKNSPNRLVAGDDSAFFTTQLVLNSNASNTSDAGQYFIGVAQPARDNNYDVPVVFGENVLFDGLIRDNVGQVVEDIGRNVVPFGDAFPFGNGLGQSQRRASLGTARGILVSVDRFGDGGNDVIDFDAITGGDQTRIGFTENYVALLDVDQAELQLGPPTLMVDVGSDVQGALEGVDPVATDPTELRNGDTVQSIGFLTDVRFVTDANSSSLPGSHPVFSFGGTAKNYRITHVDGEILVQPIEGLLEWIPTEASFVFGTPLGEGQLNPVVVESIDGTPVVGTFNTDSLMGQILPVGTHSLSLLWTPNEDFAELRRPTTVTTMVEVTPGTVTVTGPTFSRGFGAANPESFTPIFSGFIPGEDAGVLTQNVEFATDGIAGANVGVYPITPFGAAAANYMFTYADGQVTITQDPVTVTLSNLTQAFNGSPRPVTVVTDPPGVAVNLTYNGKVDAPTAVGRYGLRALTPPTSNYVGFATGTLVVNGTATVAITERVKVFNGQPQGPLVKTTPAGLSRSTTFDGSTTKPTAAGTYQVQVTVTDSQYTGSGSDVFEITPAVATVVFEPFSLTQPINELTGVMVTTTPPGLNVEVFYDDLTSLPTEIGSVPVRAVVNERNWTGMTTGTFTVARASQTITTFPFPEFTLNGSPLNVGLFATASSGLPVTFAVQSGAGSITGNTLTITQPGDVVVLATQAGNDDIAPESELFTITATGQGIAQQVPVPSVAGFDGTAVQVGLSGAPGATVRILTSPSPLGPFVEAAVLTLDGSGSGSFNLPVDGFAGYVQVLSQ